MGEWNLAMPGYSIKFERVKEREPDSRVPSLCSGYLRDGLSHVDLIAPVLLLDHFHLVFEPQLQLFETDFFQFLVFG